MKIVRYFLIAMVFCFAMPVLTASKTYAFWPFGHLENWIEGDWYFKDTDTPYRLRAVAWF